MKRHRTTHSRLSPRTRRILLLSLSIALGLFIVVNGILWAMYRNRTYPNTQLMGTSIGSTSYGELSGKVAELGLLPESVELVKDDKKATVTLDDLGIYQQTARTTTSANQQRSWLPIVNLFKSPQLKAPVAVDSKAFDATAKKLAETFYQEATDAKLALEGKTVQVSREQAGFSLDQKALQDSILTGLDRNEKRITVPTKAIAAKTIAADLKDEQELLKRQLATTVTYKYNGKAKTATADEVAAWFEQSGSVYTISIEKVRAYITQVGSSFGIRVKDINQAVSTTSQQVSAAENTTITLTAQLASKTFTYCTATKNVSDSYLPGLKSKLQSSFSDPRGWSVGGIIEYREVSSGCDFTVWLSAADQMPTFGVICDSMWSCRVGRNVVINFDRWQNASPAWNANGGTLDEYRYMVINHETGHWLGFGHSQCPGAGQAAPVMQQQSINLQGCTFNAWPTSQEQNVLRQRLGI